MSLTESIIYAHALHGTGPKAHGYRIKPDRVLARWVNEEGSRVWTCTTCGAQDTWGPTWESYGTPDCTEAVLCSPECSAKFKAKRARPWEKEA